MKISYHIKLCSMLYYYLYTIVSISILSLLLFLAILLNQQCMQVVFAFGKYTSTCIHIKYGRSYKKRSLIGAKVSDAELCCSLATPDR